MSMSWRFAKIIIGVAVTWVAFMSLATILLVSLITSCHAADLLVGGYSYHFDKPDAKFGEPEKYNESNELIGIKFDHVAITAMKNSYYQDSYSVLAFYEEPVSKNIDLIFTAGASSGYQDSDLHNVDGVAAVFYLCADFHPASDKFGVVFSIAPNLAAINFRVNL